MLFFKKGCIFSLNDLPLFREVDFYWEVPNLEFRKKVASYLKTTYKLPIKYLNLEYYEIKQPLEKSFFIFSFPNLIVKKADFLPSLAIQPVWETSINMPIDVLYSPNKVDTEGAYTYSIEGDFIKLPEISVLSVLYEVYANDSNSFYLCLKDEDEDVWFKVNVISPQKIELREVNVIKEELPLIDKGWLKFLKGENSIRFFGKIFNGKFFIEEVNDGKLLLKKGARQPSTTWEINEPYAPLPYAFPVSFSSDSDLYFQSWPYQWARYPGSNLKSILWEILKSLKNNIDIEELIEEEDEEIDEKRTDLDELLEKLDKESSLIRETFTKLGYKDYSTFYNEFLTRFLSTNSVKKNRVISFLDTINSLVKEADVDLTRLTDKDKEKLYNEIKSLKEELSQKDLTDTELRAELFKVVKERYPHLKDQTVFLAVDKIIKNANVYSDKEQPVILPDDYGVGLFPHHDFSENTTDTKQDDLIFLDSLDQIEFALPTGGSYLISLPSGEQFLVDEDDWKDFLHKKKKKLRLVKKKASSGESKRDIEDFNEAINAIKDFIFFLKTEKLRLEEVSKVTRYQQFLKDLDSNLNESEKFKRVLQPNNILVITEVRNTNKWYLQDTKLIQEFPLIFFLRLYWSDKEVQSTKPPLEGKVILEIEEDNKFRFEVYPPFRIDFLFDKVLLAFKKSISKENLPVSKETDSDFLKNILTLNNILMLFLAEGFDNNPIEERVYISLSQFTDETWKKFLEKFLIEKVQPKIELPPKELREERENLIKIKDWKAFYERFENRRALQFTWDELKKNFPSLFLEIRNFPSGVVSKKKIMIEDKPFEFQIYPTKTTVFFFKGG